MSYTKPIRRFKPKTKDAKDQKIINHRKNSPELVYSRIGLNGNNTKETITKNITEQKKGTATFLMLFMSFFEPENSKLAF